MLEPKLMDQSISSHPVRTSSSCQRLTLVSSSSITSENSSKEQNNPSNTDIDDIKSTVAEPQTASNIKSSIENLGYVVSPSEKVTDFTCTSVKCKGTSVDEIAVSTEPSLESDSSSSTIASFFVKELEKFDPTVPDDEEEFSPQLPRTQKSEEENISAIRQFFEQKMEIHTIHPVIQSFLVGSMSGTCSTILFQPLDLLKTRLQAPLHRHGAATTALRASSAAAAATANPNGLFTVIGHIVRDEKIRGLWKGMTPSLTRCVPGVGLYFASIHGLKRTFNIHGEPTPLQSVFLGVTGRSISGVMMIPFTVIKTRFESTVYNYGSIREALYSIYQKEGIRGLTCGLLPTLLRDAPFSGLYLLMYTSTKKGVPQEWIESTTFGPYVRFSCGVVAGIGASLVTQPADVLKTKMQLYPDKFHSIPEVVVYVYKKYGAQGYFKGLLPRMVRRTLIAAMSWTVYEQMMKSIGLK